MEPHNGDNVFFDAELKVFDGSNQQEILCNMHRTYTVAAFYPPRSVYYIALTAPTFQRYICSWLLHTRDCYIGYCEKPGSVMVEFTTEGIEAANTEDLKSDGMISEL